MLAGCTPWPAELVGRYRQQGLWRDETIVEAFAAQAARTPGQIALVDAERRLSYAEVLRLSERLAAHFHQAGLRSRERVVLQLPNRAEFVLVLFALLRIGVIPVLALPSHRETEVSHYVEAAQATALFTPDRTKDFDFRVMAETIRKSSPSLTSIFVLGEAGDGQVSIGTLLATEPDPQAMAEVEAIVVDPADVALMLLSGGTTALPKLIPRTHNDYVYNYEQAARAGGVDERTVMLLPLPLAHNYNLACPGILGVLSAGGRAVVTSGGDAQSIFEWVERERVTIIAAALPLIVKWLDDPVVDHYDHSSLAVIQQGGARLPSELRQRLRQRFGCQFQEVYGTAEGLLNLTRLDDPDEVVLESSGWPICDEDEIKVVDEAGREVPDGERGELLTRGPYTIRGYYNAPCVNARAFTADGFYRMGDIVRKQGRLLFVEGRSNDLINRGGEKINIDEVENLILGHPAVEAAALVAMPDPVFGERACAFVTLREGGTLDFDGLTRFLLSKRIAKFKLPERLEILPEFPVSGAGKILRRTLRQTIEAKLASEHANAA